VHGAALGDAEVTATREHIGWKYPPFEIPKHVYEHGCAHQGRSLKSCGTTNSPNTSCYPKEACRIHAPYQQ